MSVETFYSAIHQRAVKCRKIEPCGFLEDQEKSGLIDNEIFPVTISETFGHG